MKQSPLTIAVSILLAFALVTPATFFAAPQKVVAAESVIEVGKALYAGIKTSIESTIGAIVNTITSIATPISAAANVAMQINDYVLQPLAFLLSGELLKMITASVIAFVIGKANGTGVPQFVVDVRKSLQTVGDVRALTFFDQFGRNSNSPFAGSIVASLRKDYLNKTSLAGFWAANMNTLERSTPSYRPGYLAGNWSQGGVRAWFALTTQVQNNPYMLHQNAQSKLSDLIGPGIGGATGARVAELNWGKGFMSWCGSSDTAIGALTTTTAAEKTETKGKNPQAAAVGVNPGDPCVDTKTGLPGTVKTPGSVIVASLNKVLGGQQDQIVRMGNVGPEINGILKNVGTIVQTVDFAAKILGGPGSGGLFGVDQPSGSGSGSRLIQYQNEQGNLGVTNADVYNTAAALPSSGTDMLNKIAQYEPSWNTLRSAANSASTTVANLADFCIAQQTVAQSVFAGYPEELSSFISASSAQAAAARTAIKDVIAPVLTQADTASTSIAAARAMVQKIKTNLTDSGTAGTEYISDVQTLQKMPPTAEDIALVLQESQSFDMAAAVPAGSLNVAGGTILDRMSLVSTNAAALKLSVCTPVAPASSSGG